jgi:dTDP-glucose 4,6-dehydratase
MKILITGVNGFIATNIVDYFLKNTEHDVVGLSKTTHATFAKKRIDDLQRESKKFRYYSCDITDNNKLRTILDKEKPDQILHLAAEADVSRSFDYPLDYLRVNVEGTFNILEWLRHTGKETRMVHFSTDEVFGEPEHKSKEGERLHPKNPYSASKAATEEFVHAYNASFGTNIQIIRPVNNYGPYQGTNRLISKTIIRCLTNEPFYLFAETQKHKRWWIHAEDTARAVEVIMSKGDSNGVYNVTSDTEMYVEETVFVILDMFGKRDLFKGYSEGRPKDDENYALDGHKIKSLGWKEKYTFEQGIRQTIEWYKQNLDWFVK